jgi:hypothetical protein
MTEEEKQEQGRYLTEKIKRCLEEDMLTFNLVDGKLVAIGYFGGGADTIGHDQFSICSWEDFIKHS